MLCESIRPRIRTFLDDLLDEKDYQAIQAHLGCCERCHSYAASVGTLSYRLYELGQVSVPPDLASTVLYRLDKQRRVVPATPQDKGATAPMSMVIRLFWIAAFLCIAAIVVAVSMITSRHKLPKEDEASPAIKALVALPATVTDIEKPKTAVTFWHYHASKFNQAELKQLLKDLDLPAIEESQSHFVFDIPSAKLAEFVSRLAALSGAAKEYGEMDPAGVSTDVIRISIYLE